MVTHISPLIADSTKITFAVDFALEKGVFFRNTIAFNSMPGPIVRKEVTLFVNKRFTNMALEFFPSMGIFDVSFVSILVLIQKHGVIGVANGALPADALPVDVIDQIGCNFLEGSGIPERQTGLVRNRPLHLLSTA